MSQRSQTLIQLSLRMEGRLDWTLFLMLASRVCSHLLIVSLARLQHYIALFQGRPATGSPCWP